jgi:molybdopterin-synthase adenylyltransferase
MLGAPATSRVPTMRPRLKAYNRTVAPGAILLVPDSGVEITLGDPDGRVLALLELLDGTRTIEEIAAALDTPVPDVVEGVAALDEAGLLEDADATTELTPRQRERYFSNLAFFGAFAGLSRSRYSFQEALCNSHVLLLGVGGLGSTLLMNLAGLGVGRVTALDNDKVELKNFSRQFLYSEADIGQPKLPRALERARSFNSELELVPVERWVEGPEDVAPLLPGVDLVLSAIDQPVEVQTWVDEACVGAGVPYITGGMQIGRGQYFSVEPGVSGCRACWRRAAAREHGGLPPIDRPERVNRGIGPVASLLGSLIALEALRYLTRFAPPISAGKLWIVDFATGDSDVGYEWPRDPECSLCGSAVAAETR